VIGIYKITSPSNRIYIGQSINIDRRFSQYRRLDNSVRTSPKLFRSLKKYGYEKHIFEVIETCDVDVINERERYWQEFYDANSPNNLNCLLTSTLEKKQTGLKLSEDHKKQISKVHKGKVYSEETRQKIRLARAKQVITQEHKDKISLNSGSARLVLNTSNGIYYRSAKEAAESINMKSNSLVCRLIGKIKNNTNLVYV
jgi:group I intron endonuclease